MIDFKKPQTRKWSTCQSYLNHTLRTSHKNCKNTILFPFYHQWNLENVCFSWRIFSKVAISKLRPVIIVRILSSPFEHYLDFTDGTTYSTLHKRRSRDFFGESLSPLLKKTKYSIVANKRACHYVHIMSFLNYF